MSTNLKIEDLNITNDEAERLTDAFKKDEFKKMFFDYCQEIQDPENMKLYEKELIQLESERGVDVTFLYPEPGFVLKTSINGKDKTFINIAKCSKIEKPNYETPSEKGVNLKLPYAQSPPRHDYDKNGKKCMVYDVLFHPDAHDLALTNYKIREYMIQTACDAIEIEFHVKLDRTNLKFLHMKFKGLSRPIIIRKLSSNFNERQHDECDPLNSILPPIPSSKMKSDKPKIHVNSYKNIKSKDDDYTRPNYVIKHKRDVDLAEMTYELDAKLNLTIPKELIIEIDLPLLNTANDCTLDVHDKQLYLKSKRPAKYKLNIILPFSVNDKEGSAKFDKKTRKLIVRLPVSCEKYKNLNDLMIANDKGNEMNQKKSEKVSLIEEIPSPSMKDNEEGEVAEGVEENENEKLEKIKETFLAESIQYNFLDSFKCTKFENKLFFILHVANIDPSSIAFDKNEKFLHMKFTSLGNGYYPIHYAFYVKFDPNDEIKISSFETEIKDEDNVLLLTLTIEGYENFKSCLIGSNENDVELFEISKEKFENENSSEDEIEEINTNLPDVESDENSIT